MGVSIQEQGEDRSVVSHGQQDYTVLLVLRLKVWLLGPTLAPFILMKKQRNSIRSAICRLSPSPASVFLSRFQITNLLMFLDCPKVYTELILPYSPFG